MKPSDLKKNHILQLVQEYYILKQQEKEIDNKIHYAGRVYNEEELMLLVESALDFQLTNGRFIKQFEKNLSKYLNVKYSLMVNSGSSANLLAFMTLTSPRLKNRQIKKGDEIITVAAAFPTTISPIINYGAIPVFVDVDINNANIKIEYLEEALSKKTKAIFIAHTLGIPFNINKIQEFCKKHNLWLIADCCDSLGTTYDEKSLESQCDIATSSFYPAHHITCGNGGAIHTNNKKLYMIAKSFAEWGRDYKCVNCKSNCDKRYKDGYDCRYSYSHLGYNLQPTEMQAAIGLAQLSKLNDFKKMRRNNWIYLFNNLKNLNNYFYFQTEIQYKDISTNESNTAIVEIIDADISLFTFLITLKPSCKFTRNDIVQFLENNNIETRFMFAGNILKQKCCENLKINEDYRIVGNLTNTNYIMENSFFIGVYPGLTEDNLKYMADKINEFMKENK